eukprot:s4396_g4.t1
MLRSAFQDVDPLALAMLETNLLVPKWHPRRRLVTPNQLTRSLLVAWADALCDSWRIVAESLDAEELPSSLRQRMLQMLGSERIGFLSLIDQLVHMERCWGLQDADLG